MESGQYQLLPPLSTKEYAALKSDILARGVQVPVEYDEDGNILDGHHRVRACQELGGIDWPRVVRAGLTEAEKVAHVYRANFARRNLSKEQKAGLRKQMKGTALALNAEGKTQAEIGALLGMAQQTVSHWLATSHTQVGQASRPTDLRVKLKPEHKEKMLHRVDKGESQTQVAADFGISQQRVSQVVKTERKKAEAVAERARMVEEGPLATIPEAIQLLHGDFRELAMAIPDNSIDLIFTDPPYDEKSLPIYASLARETARVLKAGGSLIAYTGHYALPIVLPLMVPHLRFWWILALEHSGPSARLPGKWVYVGWKPLLWFVKEGRRDKEYVRDIFKSNPPDKVADDWQQGVSEAAYYIEHLTKRGEVVFDPMMGSGTTLVATLQAGRRGIGMDTDESKVMISRTRVVRL